MIEILVLIFLCRKIGNKALRKGLKPGQWKLITVLTWLCFEFIGFTIGMVLFGFDKSDLLGLMAFGVACAFGGYLLVDAVLSKKPDLIDDNDINNLGAN